jgi:citrate synthase
VASSRISYIDGDRGILEYRGYPIEQLAEQSTFTEVRNAENDDYITNNRVGPLICYGKKMTFLHTVVSVESAVK